MGKKAKTVAWMCEDCGPVESKKHLYLPSREDCRQRNHGESCDCGPVRCEGTVRDLIYRSDGHLMPRSGRQVMLGTQEWLRGALDYGVMRFTTPNALGEYLKRDLTEFLAERSSKG